MLLLLLFYVFTFFFKIQKVVTFYVFAVFRTFSRTMAEPRPQTHFWHILSLGNASERNNDFTVFLPTLYYGCSVKSGGSADPQDRRLRIPPHLRCVATLPCEMLTKTEKN